MSYHYTAPTQPGIPTVVLLHGFVSSRNYWSKVEPLLVNAGYGVMAIDLLGFGDSRHTTAKDYTYESQVDHIITHLKRLNMNQPIILVGHSMGSLIANYFSHAHPEKISKLVMLNPPIYLTAEQALSTLYSTGWFYRYILTGRFRSVVWGALKILPNKIAQHSGVGREESLLSIILNDDNAKRITHPAVPTHLVVGTRDRHIYLENVRLLKLSPQVNLVIVETNHHSPRTEPELVNEIITKNMS